MDLSGQMHGDVIVHADGDGFPPFDASRARPASLADCRDVADQLDYLCGQVQGSYQRTRSADGSVTVRLKTADGDVYAATRPSTEACVAQLLTRAGVTA
jgi:hypothetical protein